MTAASCPRPPTPSRSGYDEERGEVGGFGGTSGRINIVQQMNHDGEVNRARYCPQNHFLLATKTVSAEVYVFDYSKHPSKPAADGLCKPDIRLLGHKNEGYGLSWSDLQEGYLLSGSDDAQICVWDVKATTQSNRVRGVWGSCIGRGREAAAHRRLPAPPQAPRGCAGRSTPPCLHPAL